MTTPQKFRLYVSSITVFLIVILLTAPAFLKTNQEAEDELAQLTYQQVDLHCQVTDNYEAVVRVAVLNEAEINDVEAEALLQQVCGALENNGTLILDIAYEEMK